MAEQPDSKDGPAQDIARGERLLAAGQAEAALAALRPAAESADPAARAQALDAMGRAFLALENPGEALKHAERALAAHRAAAISANRARALLRLGRGDEATQAADAALALHPTEARALAVRAEVAASRGDKPAIFAPAPEKLDLPEPIADALASAGDAMTVGVAWDSDRKSDSALDDPMSTPGAGRFSASLDLALRFFARPGARLVLLRSRAADAQARRAAQVGIVIDPFAALHDSTIDDALLAGVISRLDAVVAVDSRAAELAGLLGKHGFVLLPTGIVGRWPEAGPPDAMKSLTIHRQPAPRDWETPFRAVAEALTIMLRARKPAPAKPPPPDIAKQAQALLVQGNELHAKGDIAGAARAWRQALALNPRLPAAWGNLGVMLRVEDHPEAAIACYREALGVGSGETASTTGNMGNATKDADRLEEAIALHRKTVEMDPGKASNHHNFGISLRQAGRYREAIRCFERALQLKPSWVSAQWDLALARLHVGDFAKGWPLYEARWNLPEMSMPKLSKPLWNGEALNGQTILLHSEQGFGDAIQCVRYVPALKARGAARVVLDCKPQLSRLFATVEGLDAIAPRGSGLPPFDLHCPLNSLPGRFGTDTSSIPGKTPFIRAPAGGAAKFARALTLAGKRLKVGIVWSGSVTFKDNHHRATTLARFLSYFGLPEICLFSLQKGPPEAEIKALGADAPVVDLAPLIEDFADTAAVIDELDLVLMTDSSVSHLAGAMNRPVWQLLPYHAHWLWLENEHLTTPWYPSMRFFRQPAINDWDTPFGRAADALIDLARQKQT